MVTEATVNPNLRGIFRDDFANSNWNLKDGENSPDGKWYCRYGGYGYVKSATWNGTKVMMLEPAVPANTAGDETRACSVVARQKFKNFDMTCKMATLKQTRGANSGNNWEVAWIFFRLSDQSHHYYLFIQKDGGLELGKKDIAGEWEERQVFLATTANNQPSFSFNRWYTIRIRAVDYHIEVWVNGIKYINIVDDGKTGNFGNVAPHPPSPQMLEGFIGPYTEDAQVVFDRFVITPLYP